VTSRPQRNRGVALLLVLWIVLLLATLIGAFALSATTEGLEGKVFRQDLVARQAARAGVEYAVLRMRHPDRQLRWDPDGSTRQWTFGEASVSITIDPESDKLDLNNAGVAEIQALLVRLGEDHATAGRIAGAVLDWRDPDPLTQPAGGAEDPDYAFAGYPHGAKDAPFEDLAELLQVLGMTPQLYALAAPQLTVHGQAGTYSIRSEARLRGGRASTLIVVLRGGAAGTTGAAYKPLRWEEGTFPR